MPKPPANPKIYHIVHVDRLSSIIGDGYLWADAVVLAGKPKPGSTIGMQEIKQRRLRLPVPCHPGCKVGDFVPFYFCSRSIMLYVINCANHPNLAYRGGQGPIVHLEADLYETIEWAKKANRKWAISLMNASVIGAEFRSDLDGFDEVNWPAIAARDFRPTDVREGKQAEFLVERAFPWTLVRRVGVRSVQVAQQVHNAMEAGKHRPTVQVLADWYY